VIHIKNIRISTETDAQRACADVNGIPFGSMDLSRLFQCNSFSREHTRLTSQMLLKTLNRSSKALGDRAARAESFRMLATLPPETVLIPGHGETTTLADELKNNPVMKRALNDR